MLSIESLLMLCFPLYRSCKAVGLQHIPRVGLLYCHQV